MPFGVDIFISLQQKGASYIKTTHYHRVQRLPGRPPRVRTSQTRDNSSSSNDVRICCHSTLSPTLDVDVDHATLSIATVPGGVLVPSALVSAWQGKCLEMENMIESTNRTSVQQEQGW